MMAVNLSATWSLSNLNFFALRFPSRANLIAAKQGYDSGSTLQRPAYYTFSFRGVVSGATEYLHVYNFVSDGFRVEHATQSGSYASKACLRFSSVCIEKSDGILYRYNDFLAIDSEVLFNVMIPIALQRRSGDDPVNDCYFTFVDSSRKFIKSTAASPWNGTALLATLSNQHHQYGWSSYERVSTEFIKRALTKGDSRDNPIVLESTSPLESTVIANDIPLPETSELTGELPTPVPRSILLAPSPDPTHDQLMDHEFGDPWHTPLGDSIGVPDLDSPFAWSEFG